jgi:hypothetical protein
MDNRSTCSSFVMGFIDDDACLPAFLLMTVMMMMLMMMLMMVMVMVMDALCLCHEKPFPSSISNPLPILSRKLQLIIRSHPKPAQT